MVMLIYALFSWWYGQGWRDAARRAWRRLAGVSHLFSVPILLRTLWAPWRRIVTVPGSGFDAQLRAMTDNLVSRVVGFTVRIVVLIAAACILLVTALVGIMHVLLWPLVPIGIPLLIIKGIIG